MTSTAHLSSNLATNCKLFKIRQTYPIIITASNGLSLLSFLLSNLFTTSTQLLPLFCFFHFESRYYRISIFGILPYLGIVEVFSLQHLAHSLIQTFKNSSRFNHNLFLFYSYVLIIINFLSRLEDIYIHPPLHRLKLLIQVHISITWLVFALCNFRFPTFC